MPFQTYLTMTHYVLLNQHKLQSTNEGLVH